MSTFRYGNPYPYGQSDYGAAAAAPNQGQLAVMTEHNPKMREFWEILRTILSYAVEGLALSTAAYALPKLIRKGSSWSIEDLKRIIAIGLVAAAVFALLDIYAPRIGGAARLGAGIAIGAMQIGGLPTTNIV